MAFRGVYLLRTFFIWRKGQGNGADPVQFLNEIWEGSSCDLVGWVSL